MARDGAMTRGCAVSRAADPRPPSRPIAVAGDPHHVADQSQRTDLAWRAIVAEGVMRGARASRPSAVHLTHDAMQAPVGRSARGGCIAHRAPSAPVGDDRRSGADPARIAPPDRAASERAQATASHRAQAFDRAATAFSGVGRATGGGARGAAHEPDCVAREARAWGGPSAPETRGEHGETNREAGDARTRSPAAFDRHDAETLHAISARLMLRSVFRDAVDIMGEMGADRKVWRKADRTTGAARGATAPEVRSGSRASPRTAAAGLAAKRHLPSLMATSPCMRE